MIEDKPRPAGIKVRDVPDRSQSMSRGQILVLFVFVALAFILLAWRSELNTAGIRENTAEIERAEQVNTYTECQAQRDVLERLNVQLQALADNDRSYLGDLEARGRAGEPVNARLVQLLEDRIEIYETGAQPLPDCTRFAVD